MSESNSSSPHKTIVSVTFCLIENHDGARFWEPMSGLEDAHLTVEDLAKFQFHLLHWHAAMQETLVRHLQKIHARQAQDLIQVADQLKEKLKDMGERVNELEDQLLE